MKNKLVFLLFGFSVLSASAVIADSEIDACLKTIKTHGFLSRAQFQCGFSGYSQSMTDAAKRCVALLPADQVKERLTYGMALFDENETEKGRDVICEELLQSFSGILQP